MNGREIERESWRMAAQNASPVGLAIILYDLLASDLRAGIDAIRSGDIERRCREINHAFLVLGQLEASLEMEQGGETARNLSRFYSHLRAKVLEAQMKQSAEILESQIKLVVQVRAAWQQLELRERTTGVMLAGAPISSGPSGDASCGWSA